MRLALVIFGVLFMLVGLLPLLKKIINIPLLPTEGVGYNVLVVFTGFLAALVGLVGFQQLVKPKI